jgi:hypothetical protein
LYRIRFPIPETTVFAAIDNAIFIHLGFKLDAHPTPRAVEPPATFLHMQDADFYTKFRQFSVDNPDKSSRILN